MYEKACLRSFLYPNFYVLSSLPASINMCNKCIFVCTYNINPISGTEFIYRFATLEQRILIIDHAFLAVVVHIDEENMTPLVALKSISV